MSAFCRIYTPLPASCFHVPSAKKLVLGYFGLGGFFTVFGWVGYADLGVLPKYSRTKKRPILLEVGMEELKIVLVSEGAGMVYLCLATG